MRFWQSARLVKRLTHYMQCLRHGGVGDDQKHKKDITVHADNFPRKALPPRSQHQLNSFFQASLPTQIKNYTLAVAVGLLLAACAKPVEKVEDIRPVRVIKLQAGSVDSAYEFSGEVKPRIESRLGFRVGGKIASRKVEVGMLVKRGQILLQLDPQDLALAQLQGQAALRSAKSNRDLAQAERKRYQELRDKNFVSQAVLDGKETAFMAAQSGVEQAQAALQAQANQSSYASLVSDTDGVVTSIDAEVGQVVAAGAPVVRVAQMGEKEVVIGIPENKVDVMSASKDVQIRLWANQELLISGKVREIAPVADPATRTYTAKVSLQNPPAEVKLGMTAYVSFVSKLGTNMIKVPLNALYQEKNVTSVWVVENEAVKLVPVVVAGPSGNEMLLAKGVSPGQIVVTAGVNLLKPGQKVKILAEAPTTQPAAKGESFGNPVAQGSASANAATSVSSSASKNEASK